MVCETWTEKLDAYLDGELPAAEASAGKKSLRCISEEYQGDQQRQRAECSGIEPGIAGPIHPLKEAGQQIQAEETKGCTEQNFQGGLHGCLLGKSDRGVRRIPNGGGRSLASS